MSFIDQLISGEFVPQGSEQWEQIRAGRFTSSEIWKIMECGTRDMTAAELAARPKTGKGSKTTKIPDPSLMGRNGMTYIMQKVAEVLTGQPTAQTYAFPLVYGNEHEPEAVACFEKVHGVTCEERGFQAWGDHAGGSPDRVFLNSNGIYEGLEVKCPFNSANQVGYLVNLKDVYELKRWYPEYYYQCISLMMFMNIPVWHFCTYDPRMIKDAHKLTHLILRQEESEMIREDQDAINTAIASATKIKLQTLKELEK